MFVIVVKVALTGLHKNSTNVLSNIEMLLLLGMRSAGNLVICFIIVLYLRHLAISTRGGSDLMALPPRRVQIPSTKTGVDARISVPRELTEREHRPSH